MLFKIFNTAFIRLVGVSINFFITLTIARQLSASDVGVYIMTVTVIFGISIFFRYGFNTIIIREIAVALDKGEPTSAVKLYQSLITFSICSSVIFSLFFVTFLLSYDSVSNWLEERLILKMAIVCIPLIVSVQLLAAVLLASSRPKLSAFIEVTLLPIVLIVLILMAGREELSLKYVGDSYVVASGATCVLSLIFVLKLKEATQKSLYSLSVVKQHLKSGLHFLLHDAVIYFVSSLPLIMLSIYGSNMEVGIFGVLVRTIALLAIVATVINSLIAPKLATYWHRNEVTLLLNVYLFAVAIFALLLFVVMPSCILFSEYYLSIFGSEFVGSEHLLVIIVFAQLIAMLIGPSVLVISMMRSDETVFKMSLVTLCLVSVLCIVFIPWLGLMGAVIAASLSNIGQKLISLRFLFALLPDGSFRDYRPSLKQIIKTAKEL